MKKRFFLFPIMLLGLFFAVAACESEEPEPVESCESDVFCDQKEVTVCCTDNVCVYKFNEKEYQDNETDLAQLSTDLGCTAKKSASYESDMAMITERLQVIRDIALANQ